MDDDFSIALYNGIICISHIVKTQKIILINLTNTVVQRIVMAYSHILMVMLGQEVESVALGNEDTILFWPTSSKYSICSKYFIWWHLVAMWNFRQIFQNCMWGEEGLTILANFSKNLSPSYKESCKICQLRMMKTLTNQNWSRGWGWGSGRVA